jgi:hypothetical protein
VKLGSTLSPKFFDTYRHLPPGIRAKARESYRLFAADSASVKFKTIKRLADGNQLCSARVTRDCRSRAQRFKRTRHYWTVVEHTFTFLAFF